MATTQLARVNNTESNIFGISKLQKLLFFRPTGLKSLMRGRHWENLNKKKTKLMEKLACGKNLCVSRLQIEALEQRIVPAAYDLANGAYVAFDAAGGGTAIVAFSTNDANAVLQIDYTDDGDAVFDSGDTINFFTLGETGGDADGATYNVFTNFGSAQMAGGALDFFDAGAGLDGNDDVTVNITTGVNFGSGGAASTDITMGATTFTAATTDVDIAAGADPAVLGGSINLLDFSDISQVGGITLSNDINVTIGSINASGDINQIQVDALEAIGSVHAGALQGTLAIDLNYIAEDPITLAQSDASLEANYTVSAGAADFTLTNLHYVQAALGSDNALLVDNVAVAITSGVPVTFTAESPGTGTDDVIAGEIDLMGDNSSITSNEDLTVNIEHGGVKTLTTTTGANLAGMTVAEGNGATILVDGIISGNVTATAGALGNITVTNSADLANGITGNISAIGLGAIDVNGNITGNIAANAGDITSINVHSDITGNITGANIGPITVDGGISGNIIATGSISTIGAGTAITSANITAATNITSITAGTGITGGAIQATAGSIGTVTATTGNISDTITAGTTIGTVTTLSATGDIAGAVTANGLITLVSAGRDITAAGDITSNTGNVTTVTAVRDIAGDVKATAGSIGTVTATTGAITGNITAPTAIGTVTAQTGINSVINSAGTDGADVNLSPDAGTGTIGSVTANTGSIAGTITAGTTLGTVTATAGAITANLTAGSSITTVTAATGIGGSITATGVDGEDVDVLVDAGTGTIGNVTTAAGDIAGLINANGNIGTVDATAGSVTNHVTSATGNITAVTAGTSVNGNVTATLGSVGNVEAKTTATNTVGNVAGNVTAGTTIGTVTADGNITGDLTANGGIGAITAGGNVGDGTTLINANADGNTTGTGITSITATGNINVNTISTAEGAADPDGDQDHNDNDQNNIGAIAAGGDVTITNLTIGGSATTITAGGADGDVTITAGAIDGDIDSVTATGTGTLNILLTVYNLTTGSPMFVATDAGNDDVYTIDSSTAGTTATAVIDIPGVTGNATLTLSNLTGTNTTTALAIKTTQLSDGLDSDAAFDVLGIDYNNDGGVTAAPVAGASLLSLDIEGTLSGDIDLGTGTVGSIYLEGVAGNPAIQAASLQAIGIQDEAPADITTLIDLSNVGSFVPVNVTNIQLEASAGFNTTGYYFSTAGLTLDGAIYLTSGAAKATADIDYINAAADYIVGNVVLPALGFETNVSVLSISEAGSQAGALVGFIEVEGDLGGITFTDNNAADAERANLGIVNVGYNLGTIGAAEAAPVNVKAGAVMAVASLGAVSVAGQLQGRIKVTGDIDGVTADSSLAGGDIEASGDITDDIVATAGDLDGDITAGAALLTDLGDDNAIGGIDLNADTTIWVGSILANVSASQNIDGHIWAADNITGDITATVEDINGNITAGDNITGNITAGDDIDGNITATLGSIQGNILATGTNAWGGIRGNITAGVNIIGNITATNNDIDGDITAGNNITGNITAGEDIDGNIDAGNDITGEIAAGDEIEGNITAGVDINAGYDIIAGTEISGNIIAELGNLAADNIIAGTNITGNTISAGLNISTGNILAGFTAPGVLSNLGGSINNVNILSGRVGFGNIDSDIIAADNIDPTLIDAGNGDGGSVLGDIVAGADGTGSIIELTITADQNVGSLGGGQIVAAADEITDIDVTAGVAPQAQGDGVLYSDFHADGDTTIFAYSEDPGFPVGYPDGGSITGSFVAIQNIESDFLAAHNIGSEADGVWINSVYGDINGTIHAGIGTGFVQGNYEQNYGGDIYGSIIAGHDINADIIAETGLCIWAGDIEANIIAGMNLLIEGADFINLNDDFSCPIYDTFIGVPVDGFPVTSDVQNLNDADLANGLLILGSLDTDGGDHSDVFLYHANANGMLEIDAAYSPIYDIMGDAYTPTIEIFDPLTYQPLNTTQVVAGQDYYIAIESYNFPDVDDEGGDYAVKITFVPFAGGTNYGSITSEASIIADNDIQNGLIFAVDDIVPSEVTAGDDIQSVFFLTNKGTIGADGAPLDISAGNDISNVYMMAFEDSVYLDMTAGDDIENLGVIAGGGIFGSMTAGPIINVDLVADGDVGTVDDHFVINGEWGVEDVYVEGANVYLDVLAQGLDNTDPLNPVTADIIDLEIFTEGAFGTSGSPSLVIASGSLDGAIFNIGEWQADVTVGDSILDMAIISAGDIGSTVNPLQIYAPNDIMNTGFYGNNIYVNVEAGNLVDGITFDGEGIVGLADGDLAVTGEWGVSNVYMYGDGIFMDVFAPGTYTDPCTNDVDLADIYNVVMQVNTDITPCGMYYYVGDIGTEARARIIQATGDVDDVFMDAQDVYADIEAGYDATDITVTGSDYIMTVDAEGNVVISVTAGNDIARVDVAGEGDVNAVLAAGNTVDTVGIAAGGILTGSILGYMGVANVTLTGFGGVDMDISASGVDALGNGADVVDFTINTVDGDPLTADGDVDTTVTASNDIIDANITGVDVNVILDAGNQIKGTNTVTASGVLTGDVAGYMGIANLTLTGLGGVNLDVTAAGVDALGNGSDILDLVITSVDGNPLTIDGDIGAALNAVAIFASRDIIDFAVSGRNVYTSVTAQNQIKKLNMAANTITASGMLGGEGLGLGVTGTMGVSDLSMTGLGGVFTFVSATGVDALGNGSDITNLWISASDGSALTPNGDIGSEVDSVDVTASGNIVDSGLVTEGDMFLNMTAGGGVQGLDLTAWGMMGDAAGGNLLTGMFGVDIDTLSVGGDLNMDVIAGAQMNGTPFAGNINDANLPSINSMLYAPAALTVDYLTVEGDFNSTFVAASDLYIGSGMIEGSLLGNDGLGGRALLAAVANDGDMEIYLDVYGVMAGGINVGNFVPFDLSETVTIGGVNVGPFQAGTVITLGNLEGELNVSAISGANDGIVGSDGITLDEVLAGTEGLADANYLGTTTFSATGNIDMDITATGYPTLGFEGVDYATGDISNLSMMAFGDIKGSLTAEDSMHINFIMANVDAVTAIGTSDDDMGDPSTPGTLLPNNSAEGNLNMEIASNGLGEGGGISGGVITAGFDPFVLIDAGTARPANAPVDIAPPDMAPKVPDFFDAWGAGSVKGSISAYDGDPTDGLEEGDVTLAYIAAGQNISAVIYADDDIAMAADSSEILSGIDLDIAAGLSANGVLAPFGTSNIYDDACLMPGGSIKGDIIAGDDIYSTDDSGVDAGMISIIAQDGNVSGNIVSGTQDQFDDFFVGLNPSPDGDVNGNIDAIIIASKGLKGVISAGNAGGIVESCAGSAGGSFTGTIIGGAGIDLLLDNANADAAVNVDNFIDKGNVIAVLADNDITFTPITVDNVVLDGMVTTGSIGFVVAGFAGIGSGAVTGNITAAGDIYAVVGTTMVGNDGDLIAAGGEIGGVIAGDPSNLADLPLDFDVNPSDKVFLDSVGTINADVWAGGTLSVIGAGLDINGSVFAGEYSGHMGTFTFVENGKIAVINFDNPDDLNLIEITDGNINTLDMVHTGNGGFNTIGSDLMFGFDELVIADSVEGNIFVTTGGIGSLTVSDWAIDRLGSNESARDAFRISQADIAGVPAIIANEQLSAYQSPVSKQFNELLEGATGITGSVTVLADIGDTFIWGSLTGSLVSYTGDIGEVTVGEINGGGIMASTGSIGNIYVLDDIVGATITAATSIGNVMVQDSIMGGDSTEEVTVISVTDGDLGTITVGIDPFAYGDGDKVGIDYTDISAKGDIGMISVLHGDLTESDIYNVESFDGDLGGINVKGVIDDVLIDIDGDILSHTAYFDGVAFSGAIMAGGEIDYVSITASSIGADATAIISGTEGTGALTDSEILADGVDGAIGTILVRGTIGGEGSCDDDDDWWDGTTIKAEHGTVGDIIVDKIDDLKVTAAESIGNIIALQDARKGIQDLRLTVLNVGGEIGNVVSHGDIEELSISDFDGSMGDIVSLNGWVWIENDCNEWTLEGGIGDIYASEGIWLDGISIEHGNLADDGADAVTQMSVDALGRSYYSGSPVDGIYAQNGEIEIEDIYVNGNVGDIQTDLGYVFIEDTYVSGNIGDITSENYVIFGDISDVYYDEIDFWDQGAVIVSGNVGNITSTMGGLFVYADVGGNVGDIDVDKGLDGLLFADGAIGDITVGQSIGGNDYFDYSDDDGYEMLTTQNGSVSSSTRIESNEGIGKISAGYSISAEIISNGDIEDVYAGVDIYDSFIWAKEDIGALDYGTGVRADGNIYAGNYIYAGGSIGVIEAMNLGILDTSSDSHSSGYTYLVPDTDGIADDNDVVIYRPDNDDIFDFANDYMMFKDVNGDGHIDISQDVLDYMNSEDGDSAVLDDGIIDSTEALTIANWWAANHDDEIHIGGNAFIDVADFGEIVVIDVDDQTVIDMCDEVEYTPSAPAPLTIIAEGEDSVYARAIGKIDVSQDIFTDITIDTTRGGIGTIQAGGTIGEQGYAGELYIESATSIETIHAGTGIDNLAVVAEAQGSVNVGQMSDNIDNDGDGVTDEIDEIFWSATPQGVGIVGGIVSNTGDISLSIETPGQIGATVAGTGSIDAQYNAVGQVGVFVAQQDITLDVLATNGLAKSSDGISIWSMTGGTVSGTLITRDYGSIIGDNELDIDYTSSAQNDVVITYLDTDTATAGINSSMSFVNADGNLQTVSVAGSAVYVDVKVMTLYGRVLGIEVSGTGSVELVSTDDNLSMGTAHIGTLVVVDDEVNVIDVTRLDVDGDLGSVVSRGGNNSIENVVVSGDIGSVVAGNDIIGVEAGGSIGELRALYGSISSVVAGDSIDTLWANEDIVDVQAVNDIDATNAQNDVYGLKADNVNIVQAGNNASNIQATTQINLVTAVKNVSNVIGGTINVITAGATAQNISGIDGNGDEINVYAGVKVVNIANNLETSVA